MKISILYLTKFGNGKSIANRLESILKESGHDASSFNVRKSKAKDVPKSDLYIFSSPTHIGNLPYKMRGFIKKLEAKSGAKYALLTTCIDNGANTLGKLKELIAPLKLEKATADLTVKVTGMKGPLEDGYEKKLDEFASRLL